MIRLPKMSGGGKQKMLPGQPAKALLPNVLPGVFFGLTYSRVDESFTIRLDDSDKSTFDLGRDWQSFILQFTLTWGLKRETAEQAIDFAREFGAAMVKPAENRVIQIRKPVNWPELEWKEGNSYAGQLPALATV